jgi:hypothetical protein
MAPRHAAKPPRRRHVTALVVAVVVILAAVAAAVTVLSPTSTPTAGAAVHGPLRVAAITPNGAWISPDAQLRVVFNNPLSPTTPTPTVSPAVPGTWVHLSATVLSFRPVAPWKAGRHYLVTVPASTKSASGTILHASVVRPFSVAPGSTLRLQQLLAELGYLPLRFVPVGPFNPVSGAVQRGMFTWRWRTVPAGLTSLWQPGVDGVITKGAIMRFEDVHGLATDGVATTQIFNALLNAVSRGQVDHSPYDYVDVNTAIPQTLSLYVNMHLKYQTEVNTGISSRPTAIETDPVYLRFTTTTMSGTNPDGSHYADSGIPWVSYFHGGEALHGFIRGSYGWPQSLGCVEMPYDHAHVVWPYTPIGTLVTVR